MLLKVGSWVSVLLRTSALACLPQCMMTEHTQCRLCELYMGQALWTRIEKCMGPNPTRRHKRPFKHQRSAEWANDWGWFWGVWQTTHIDWLFFSGVRAIIELTFGATLTHTEHNQIMKANPMCRNKHTLFNHWQRNLGCIPFEFALQVTHGA